jgi:hypothetical protein
VNPGANVDPDLLCPSVGIFFALESLNVAITVLVGVVHDPGLFYVTISGSPPSLADRHGLSFLCNGSQSVALRRSRSDQTLERAGCNILRH